MITQSSKDSFQLTDEEYGNIRWWFKERPNMRYMFYPGVSIYVDTIPDHFNIGFEDKKDAM